MNKKTMNRNAVILLIVGIAIAVGAYMFFFRAEADVVITVQPAQSQRIPSFSRGTWLPAGASYG